MTDNNVAYIAGSLLHVSKDAWTWYEDVARVVERHGFRAHVPHLHTTPKGTDIHASTPEGEPDAIHIYTTNRGVVESAALIVADVTNVSTGTGIEIGIALLHKKRIICLCQRDAKITRMIRGPVEMGHIDLILYENKQDALEQLEKRLANAHS